MWQFATHCIAQTGAAGRVAILFTSDPIHEQFK